MVKSENYVLLETIAAIGLTVALNIQIQIHVNELMKLNEYQSQGHYLTLAEGHSDFKVKTCFSRKLLSHLEPNENLYKWVGSHDQGGHHAHIW